MRLAAAAVALLAVTACGGGKPRATGVTDVVESLQRGGYVVFMRHAATGAREDRIPIDLRDCRTQRNLSAKGRAQARTIGKAFGALRIPVGAVLTSAYCRTRETARLAFGRARDENALTGRPTKPANVPRRIEAVRRLLARRPPPGLNTILVGHVVSIKPAAGIGLEAAEVAVFEPRGGRRFRLLGRIPASAWSQLAGQLGGAR